MNEMRERPSVYVDETLPERLKRIGISVLDPDRFSISCDRCGWIGIPPIQHGGGFKHGFWRCPNGCNARKRLPPRPEP